MVSVDSLSSFASQSCHKSDMFTQTVYLFVTYHCKFVVVMVVILNSFSFQLARCMLSFSNAGIKKQEPLCVAIINSSRSIEKSKRKQHTLSVFLSVSVFPLEGLGPILS